MRRVQSEESVTHATAGDAYEVMRRRRQVEGRLCFYDEDEDGSPGNNNNTESDQNEEEHDLAYAEADYIYSAMNRRPPVPLALPAPPPPRPLPATQRRSPTRAVFDSLRRSSVGDKKPALTRSSSSVAQRPSSAASRVMSSTLNRPERKSKERSPTSFRLTTATTANNNNINNGELATLASVIAVSSAAASIKRDEAERNRRITPPSTETVRVEATESSVVYVTPDHSTSERKLSEPLNTSSVRGTTTVRVGGDTSDVKNLATTIEVIGTTSDDVTKDVTTSTSDKESSSTTDDENNPSNDHEMSVKLAEQNAERLRRIRESRRRASPSVTVTRASPSVTVTRRSTVSGDEDSDYDADCSATESPRKFEKVPRLLSSSSSASSSSTCSGIHFYL